MVDQCYRSPVTQLRFDDEERESVKPRQSATAASLLKNISASSMSSDSSFFSLQSSGSKASGSNKSGGSYKLSLGLEGNIVKEADQLDETLVHEESSNSNASIMESEKADLSLEEINKTTLAVENIVSSQINKAKKTVESKSIISEGLKIDGEGNFENNHSKSLIDDHENGPKSPENYKHISVQFTNSSPFLKRSKGDLHNSVNENRVDSVPSANGSYGEESEEESSNKPVLRWTREKRKESQESLELEICKRDKAGVEQHIATVAVSREIPLYFSDAVKTQPNLNDLPKSLPLVINQEETSTEDSEKKAVLPLSEPCPNITLESIPSTLSEESFSEELQDDKAVFSSTWINTSRTNADISSPLQIKKEELSNNSSAYSKTPLGEIPLDQVLDELVKKKKICSVVEKTSSRSKQDSVEENSVTTVSYQASVNESHSAIESEVGKEDGAESWKGELEDDIHLSYHESTHHTEHESTRCDNSETSLSQAKGELSAQGDQHESFTVKQICSSENEDDAEELEGPSILITSITSFPNQSFGIQNESVCDFELRMSEGESTYDALSQENVEEEDSKEFESNQDVNTTNKVEDGGVEVCTDKEIKVTKDVEVNENVKVAEVVSKEDKISAKGADFTVQSATTLEEEKEVTEEETEHQPSYKTLTPLQIQEERSEDYHDEEYLEGKSRILIAVIVLLVCCWPDRPASHLNIGYVYFFFL